MAAALSDDDLKQVCPAREPPMAKGLRVAGARTGCLTLALASSPFFSSVLLSCCLSSFLSSLFFYLSIPFFLFPCNFLCLPAFIFICLSFYLFQSFLLALCVSFLLSAFPPVFVLHPHLFFLLFFLSIFLTSAAERSGQSGCEQVWRRGTTAGPGC